MFSVNDHDHNHAHSHDHNHAHSGDHNHAHSGDHNHAHSHSGDHNSNETLALLRYMAQHNYAHATELSEMAKRLSEEYFTATADIVTQTSALLHNAADELDRAVSSLQDEINREALRLTEG